MDHHEKLAWASRHMDALEKSITDFGNNNPYRVVRNFNHKTSDHEASVLDVKPAPPDWSLMVGDIVHALRSALDNIVYALAVKESGEHAADCSTALQFPIADHPYAWFDPVKKKGQRDRIALLALAAQAEIERLQPCNRSNKAKPHFLSVLRDLSNRDKHRRLIVTIVKASDIRISLSGTGIPAGTKIRSPFRGPLVEETIIAMWSFTPPIDPPDMEVHCDSVFDVEFGYGGPAERQPLRGVLEFIRNFIRDEVFPPLDALLA